MIRGLRKSSRLACFARKRAQPFSIFEQMKEKALRGDGSDSNSNLPPLFLEDPSNLEIYYQDIREILNRFAELGKIESKLFTLETADEKLKHLQVLIDFANRNQFYEEARVYEKCRRSIRMQMNMPWILLSLWSLILFTLKWLDESHGLVDDDLTPRSLADLINQRLFNKRSTVLPSKPAKNKGESVVTFKDVLVG